MVTKNKSKINRQWYLIDAENQILGRLSTKVAQILQGKHWPIYDKSRDTGDFVIIINCDKVKLTGKKEEQKKYIHHTGYLGGQKKIAFRDMLKNKPTQPIKLAVWGMLPKNKLRDKIILRLKLFSGSEHPHQSQNPQKIDIN